MPKTRPTDGDSNWGVTLNNHLAQTLNNNGGINTATSDPTLTSDDEGYTYINTTTGELRQWGGSSWEVLMSDVDTTNASGLDFDNSTNGFTADTVQGAIEENKTSLEDLDPADIDYDNTASGLTADNIKEAIDEVSGNSGEPFVDIKGSGAHSSVQTNTDIAIGAGATIGASGGGNIVIGNNASLPYGEDNLIIGRGNSIGTSNSETAFTIGYLNSIGNNAVGSTSIGSGANIADNTSSAFQLGFGTNSNSNTLQFESATLANSQGLYTSHTSPTNYTPADTDNVTSHLEAIDTALANAGVNPAGYHEITATYNLTTTDSPEQFFVGFVANREVNLPATSNEAGYFKITNLSPTHNIRLRATGIDHYLPGGGFNDRQNYMTFVWNGSNWVISYESFIHIAHNVNNGANAALARGTNALAVGSNSEARGDNSTAVGYQADVLSSVSNSVQLGQGTNSLSNSLQFRGVTVATDGGVFSGYSATNYTAADDSVNAHLSGIDTALASASGEPYVEVGTTGAVPTVSGFNDIAIGPSATATTTNCIAIGNNAEASNSQCIAFGPNSTANSTNAFAMGINAIATANNALAIQGSCNGQNSVSIGNFTSNDGNFSVALGDNAVVTGAGAGSVQLGGGINSTQGTLQFKDVTVANSTSIQVTTQSTGTAPTSSPAAGTLVFDTASFTMYAYDGSTWRSATFS